MADDTILRAWLSAEAIELIGSALVDLAATDEPEHEAAADDREAA
jgi:hypothetical protein